MNHHFSMSVHTFQRDKLLNFLQSGSRHAKLPIVGEIKSVYIFLFNEKDAPHMNSMENYENFTSNGHYKLFKQSLH